MESRKFRLDPGENNSFTRVLKAVFGVICIGAAIVTAVVMGRSGNISSGNIVAIVFMVLFGLWVILAGFGLTERYMIISGDTITLKDRVYSPARILRTSDIREIEFSQLKITFFLISGEVLPLRLGAYYRESSLRLMEAVEDFCIVNRLATRGIKSEKGDEVHES
jgi:hypothetical protein